MKVKKFLSVIISILTIFTMIILTSSLIIRREFTHDNINNIIEKLDLSTTLSNLDQNENDVLDNIDSALSYIGIPDNTTEKILNSEGTKNFVSTYLSNATEYLLNGKEDLTITIDDIKELIKSNLDIIESELPSNEEIYVKEYAENIYTYLDTHEKEVLSFFPSPKEILKDVNLSDIKVYENISVQDILDRISIFISNSFIAVISGILALFLISLILLNLQEFKWAKTIGKLFLIYTIFTTVFNLSIILILKLINIEMVTPQFVEIISLIINPIIKSLWIDVTIFLVISIILILVYNLYKKKQKTS